MPNPLSSRDREIMQRARADLEHRVHRYREMAASAEPGALRKGLQDAAADAAASLAVLEWAENGFAGSPKVAASERPTPQAIIWGPFPKPDSRTRGRR